MPALLSDSGFFISKKRIIQLCNNLCLARLREKKKLLFFVENFKIPDLMKDLSRSRNSLRLKQVAEVKSWSKKENLVPDPLIPTKRRIIIWVEAAKAGKEQKLGWLKKLIKTDRTDILSHLSDAVYENNGRRPAWKKTSLWIVTNQE